MHTAQVAMDCSEEESRQVNVLKQLFPNLDKTIVVSVSIVLYK